MVNGDDAFLMVNKNWGIATGIIYYWWVKRTDVLMAVNRDDVLLIANKISGINDS